MRRRRLGLADLAGIDDEEGRTQWAAYWHRLRRLVHIVTRRRALTTPPPPAADFRINGSLARVPANDHVKPSRDRPLIVYLDANGNAVDVAEKDAHVNDGALNGVGLI